MTAIVRVPERKIDPIFTERWSPRAFDSSEIEEEDLLTIFEAARWAPSSFNVQPWRFLYARRASPSWPVFLDLLIPFNRSWAEAASALVVIVSHGVMKGKDGEAPSHSHSFDAGAAWAHMALQATRMGLHTHAMVGFDLERAAAELRVPPAYRVEAAVAVGRMGDIAVLPEHLREREVPSDRLPVSEIAFEGGFPS